MSVGFPVTVCKRYSISLVQCYSFAAVLIALPGLVQIYDETISLALIKKSIRMSQC